MPADFRIAFRGLSNAPGFASVAIVTLALGIGASTAIFSVVNGMLLRPLPYPNPDRLMQIETQFQSGFTGRVSYPNFEDLREQNGTFAEMAAYSSWPTSAAAAGEAFRVMWAHVSPGFFSILGVEPAAGRVFGVDEAGTGGRVAVVSYGYWQSRLGGRTSFTDESVRVGDQAYRVIGVMPRGYDFPDGTELWVPRDPAAEGRAAHNWDVLGRLRDGVSRERAQQDMSTIARRLKQQHGDDTAMADATVRPVLERLVGDVRPAMLLLLGAAGVLLLVACVNVANLLLGRAFSRDRESALRLALGAGPARLARSFLAESLVLSLSGGALGVLIALLGVPALVALEPAGLPRAENIGVDWTVLAFALAASVLCALMIGLVPALRAAKRDMREALADGRHVHSGSPASRRLRGILVVAQIALTVVLLVSAGLLGRSLQKLLAVDPGFRTDGALVMEVWFPLPEDAAGETRIASFIEQLLARLRSTPAVERVGGVNYFPLQGGGPDVTFVVVQRSEEVASDEDFDRLSSEPARVGRADYRVASAGYFGAMGIPLIRGRLFDERDTREASHVALISASLAETRWRGEDPLGKLIHLGDRDGPLTVVGVVGDVQEYGIGASPRPTFYVNYRQRPRSAFYFNVAIQGGADAGALIATARRIAGQLDPEVPVAFKTLREIVAASLADRQFILLLLGLFGGLALVLATTGVYAATAYQAALRTPEIGVRMALGARSLDVVRMLVRQGGAFATAGIVIGLVAALASTRLLASFLYNVGTADPAIFIATAAVLLVAAIAASWIPAYRASRIDAMEALRHD